jgi:hypothetical protein
MAIVWPCPDSYCGGLGDEQASLGIAGQAI